jgi:hypothetical protein
MKPTAERPDPKKHHVRFRVLSPAPASGIVTYAILDDEMGGVIAFVPAGAQAQRIVDALNASYSVGTAKVTT